MSEAESLFIEASRLTDPAQRRAYLDVACGVDAGLREQVEALLAADHRLDSLGDLEVGGMGGLGAGSGPDPSGWVGRYKLLQKIGEGGGGEVYMADQEEPVRRRVALKILKLGMDTRAVVARFEAERQALAMMDHPNIARIFDGGATESGRPFFAMELVRGVPITDYCDQNAVPTEQRLQLFVQVCAAIQHAHQKGIIHRDIKPSNILITSHDGIPVPKVIDFGIAKATDQRLTDKTLFTRFEQFIGTPAYMSPEQAEMSGMDVDTRSDIYSLGVLLYELLTGRTPFDQRELLASGIDAMRRTIRETEPVRPSVKVATLRGAELTTTARRRSAEPPRLVRALQGDLDWIVLKCLEKDRTRRYETANGLAMDLGRFLAREPVIARPPSAGYRFRKWADRNRVLFASASAVAAAVLAGLGTSTWLFFQERAALGRATAAERAQSQLRAEAESARTREAGLREKAESNERLARAAAAKSEQVARFLGDMLSGIGPSVAGGRDTLLLREILQRSSERVGQDLREQPEVEAELRRTIGAVQVELGEYAAAEASMRRALELQRQIHGGDHREVAAALRGLGRVFDARGDWAAAEAQYREVLEMQRRLQGAESPEALQSLQTLIPMLNTRGNWAEGEALNREALAIARKLHGEGSLKVTELLQTLQWNLKGQERLADSEAVQREIVALRLKLEGPEAVAYADSRSTLADLLRVQQRPDEAQPMLEELLAYYRHRQGTLDFPGAWAVSNFAWVLREFGRLDEAIEMYRAALSAWRRLAEPNFHRIAYEQGNIASILVQQRRYTEAEAAAREEVAVRRHNRRHQPTKVSPAVRSLVGILRRLPGREDEIERILRQEVEEAGRLSPASVAAVEAAKRDLADQLRRTGRGEDASRVGEGGGPSGTPSTP